MIRIVLSALMALAPAAALAQVSVTDALAREQQIRDAIGAGPLPAPRAREGEAETPPGETGVFVLRRVDIFAFEAGIGGGMTTNAGKSDIDGRDSAYATAYADIGVDTRLGGAVDAGAHLTVSSIRYENASDLDSSSVVGAFTLGDDVWNGLYLQGNLLLGQSFDDDTSSDGTFLASSLVLSRRFALQERVSVLPFAFSSGQTADDSELRNLSLGGGLRLDVLAAPGLVVSPSVSYAWVTYPDFYEDVTFVEREDNRFYIGASAQYAITDVFLVSGSVGYTANDSTLDLSEYESFDASALLRATIRF